MIRLVAVIEIIDQILNLLRLQIHVPHRFNQLIRCLPGSLLPFFAVKKLLHALIDCLSILERMLLKIRLIGREKDLIGRFHLIRRQNRGARAVDDVLDVIDQNVLPMKETAARSGHATQAFAMMLYADWVMYQKDESRYSKALGYMEQIIHSGKYQLMPDFQSIWDQKNEWCDGLLFPGIYPLMGICQ